MAAVGSLSEELYALVHAARAHVLGSCPCMPVPPLPDGPFVLRSCCKQRTCHHWRKTLGPHCGFWDDREASVRLKRVVRAASRVDAVLIRFASSYLFLLLLANKFDENGAP